MEDSMEIRSLPRFDLRVLPTPIEEMPRLSKALGGPRILVKRDDQTGLAGGGNKTRKLEFSIGEALFRGADTIITLGGVQSNHCRQTAAAAVRAGLRCVLILKGFSPEAWNGNLLLDSLLGADIRFSGKKTREALAADVIKEEMDAGRKPFLIPVGASDEVGSPGYIFAAKEMAEQFSRLGFEPDRIILASSSYGTQAGLCVGARIFGIKSAITAINIDSSLTDLQAGVADLAEKTAMRIGHTMTFDPRDIIGYDDYLGGGYAVMGDPEIEAIQLAATCEGLLLDPVYTGRAMAGLIDLIRKREISKDETILFLHTGGSAALFAYARQFFSNPPLHVQGDKNT
jgi:D-cysteine desulfhydrase family pyridoxal phosphate-dependent enzyme